MTESDTLSATTPTHDFKQPPFDGFRAHTASADAKLCLKGYATREAALRVICTVASTVEGVNNSRCPPDSVKSTSYCRFRRIVAVLNPGDVVAELRASSVLPLGPQLNWANIGLNLNEQCAAKCVRIDHLSRGRAD